MRALPTVLIGRLILPLQQVHEQSFQKGLQGALFRFAHILDFLNDMLQIDLVEFSGA